MTQFALSCRALRPWVFTLELVFVIFSINTYGCPGLFYFYYPPPSSSARLLARVFPQRIVVLLRLRGRQHALDCSEGGGSAITTRTMTTMTRTRTLALSPMAAAAATAAITHCPSPKKWRIAGPSHESRRESSDNSAEGEDRWQHHDVDGRARQR